MATWPIRAAGTIFRTSTPELAPIGLELERITRGILTMLPEEQTYTLGDIIRVTGAANADGDLQLETLPVGTPGQQLGVNPAGDDILWTTVRLLNGVNHNDTVDVPVIAGDLIFGNVTPRWDVLPVGTPGQVLGIASGLPTWRTPSTYLAHTLLDASFHTDTVAAAPTIGAIIIGNIAGPAWAPLPIGGVGAPLVVNPTGNQPVWVAPAPAADQLLHFNGSDTVFTIGLLYNEATGTLFLKNNGGIVVGHTAQIDFGAIPEFQVLGTTTPDSSMGFARFENNASGPDVRFLKSRGATIGANTIVQNGDTLGRFRFQGADGGDFNTTAAQVSAEVDGVPALNDIPGRLIFATRISGGALAERWRITNAGHLLPKLTNTYNIGSTTIAVADTHTTRLLFKGTTSGLLTHAAPATITSHTLTWPSAVGAAQAVLTDAAGNGTLSWAVPSTVHVISIALERLLPTGNDKEAFKIQVPEAGWTLVEVAGKLRVTGTTFTIQLREITNAGVDNGDVLTAPLAFGAADNAQTTAFALSTPAKNVHYALDIDASAGAPAGLALELRFAD